MSQTVRGVIARQKGEPVELVNIVVPDPGPGEAVVDVTACGVCHTDLTYREGGINDEYPFLQSFRAVSDGDAVRVGGTELRALHTPGHSPGSVCWYAPELGPGTGTVFSGDTLFAGGPGATGRSYSDFPTILRSISGRLGALPGDTVVHTGHGDSTTIGDEIVHYEEWVARGH